MTRWSGCGSRARGVRRCIEYLERNHQHYDILIFFTYLYAPTVLGVRIAPHKTILVPTAHDEPAIHLDIYKELFSAPAGIAYNTDVERRFLTTHFSIRAVEEETVGCGVDLPQAQMHQRDRADEADETEPVAAGRGDAATRTRPPSWRPHLAGRGVLFRRRHRLHGPIALYGGRIDPGKGCEELIEYFSSYVQDGGDASLVLMGVKLMPLPEEPFIRFAGRLSDTSACRRSKRRRSSSSRRRTRACRCSRSSHSPSARRFSPTRAARCSSTTARRAMPASTTPIATSSSRRLKLLVGRPSAARRDGPQRPRLRAEELPLGRDPGEVRADVHAPARALNEVYFGAIKRPEVSKRRKSE